MTEKEMRKLSRTDLLEMLIDQSAELQALREKLDAAESALRSRELTINSAGSIAEASLKLNGVFEAAQAASEQYVDNIRWLSERQTAVCAQIEQECREKAESQLAQTQMQCEAMESETKLRCDEMVAKAKAETETYWDSVVSKLDAYYAEHTGLKELLSIALHAKKQE